MPKQSRGSLGFRAPPGSRKSLQSIRHLTGPFEGIRVVGDIVCFSAISQTRSECTFLCQFVPSRVHLLPTGARTSVIRRGAKK